MQNDLDKLSEWGKARNLKLNGEKCSMIRIAKARDLKMEGYSIDQKPIGKKEEEKLLGFWIDNKLNYEKQCHHRIRMAYSAWYGIWHNIKEANWKILNRMYKVYILPILDYGSNVWQPNRNQMNRIEKVQRDCTKIILKRHTYNLSYANRLKILDLKWVETRYQISKIKTVAQIVNDNRGIPDKWKGCLETYESRTGRKIKLARVTRYKTDRAPFRCGAIMFNQLPSTF